MRSNQMEEEWVTYTHEEVLRPFLPKTLGYAETMYEGKRLGCLLMERIAFTFHELLAHLIQL